MPAPRCVCRKGKGKKTAPCSPAPPSDGSARVQRETKGHGGKTVTLVYGLGLDEQGLEALAKRLKVRCGTGGTVKDGVIAIQGDHRQSLVDELKKAGVAAKIAGG
jgi:translation initiation factor 1